VLIGHIAEGTKSIKVGSGGIMLPNHSPLIVAEQFGTLGTMYPNRIDLGLGRAPGTDQITAHAIRSDRMQSVNNFPGEIKQIQQYFSEENAFEPVRATMAEGVEVPIYILGSSTDSAHLAAKMGLPYAFASHFATAQLFEALAIYRNEFQPSEHLSEPYTIGCINVIAADTDEEAERNFTSLIRMFLGVLTGKREYLQPPMEMTDELLILQHNPTIKDMLRYSFVGRKEAVQKQTLKFLEQTGVDELMVVSNMYDHGARVRSYQIFAEIMKELNEGIKVLS
jgi:luciferase family oxidoreductase group 1